MGCFGYICKGCKTSIRGNCWDGGEKAVLIHVRNGVELGRVEGHYDEYGRVIEQEHLHEEEKFRGDHEGINGHHEICRSEFSMDDSYHKVQEKRMYEDKAINFYTYASRIISKEGIDNMKDIRQSYLYTYVEDDDKEIIEDEIAQTGKTMTPVILVHFSIGLEYLKYDHTTKLYKEYMKLKQAKLDEYSGTVAWHSLCFSKATEEERNNLTPSESDPNQSWGNIRKKYI